MQPLKFKCIELLRGIFSMDVHFIQYYFTHHTLFDLMLRGILAYPTFSFTCMCKALCKEQSWANIWTS